MSNQAFPLIKPLGFPWETFDPFLFCAHHRDIYPKGNGALGPYVSALSGRNLGQDFTLKDGFRMYHGKTIPGFPFHPHRGFETITINQEGIVDHFDSLGAAGRFAAGDVQWVTTGKGIQHSEMFPLLNEEAKNPLEIFQIWLNLPKKSKLVAPHYKMFWREEIPKINIEESGRSVIDLIAGNWNAHLALPAPPNSWAAERENGVMVLTIKMEAHARLTVPATQITPVHRTLYFYRGKMLQMAGKEIESNHLVQVDASNELEIINGPEEAFLLLLQGKPIGEPVAQYGPFVMNTHKELEQAFKDYQQTEFGGWPWPRKEHAHPKARGRFALFADGNEEIKP